MYQNLESINNRFIKFQDGVRLVMLINRGIQNSNKGSKRWINKIITTNQKEWIEAIGKLALLQDTLNDPDIRIYSSVNSRNLDKAISMFKHKQIDLLPDMKIKFYSKINDTFASCLMKPENKASKFFLIDIDTKDTYDSDKFISDNLIEVVTTYETKMGWHYICAPFNVSLTKDIKTFTVIKDGLLLIRYINPTQISI